jgi:putative autotransporter adhesin-like protein
MRDADDVFVTADGRMALSALCEKGGAVTVAPTSARRQPEQHRARWVLVAILAFLLGGLVVALVYEFDVFGGSSTSTAEGSGVSATQRRDVASFESVELAGGNNVVIHVGQKRSVVVRADDNLLNSVTTAVKSGTLVIGNTPGSLTARSPMSVVVGVPTLRTLTLAGGGNIVVTGIDAESLRVTLSGGGNLTGSGTAASLHVSVDGSGNAWFTNLVASDVHAVVSGSGNIYVTATKSLDASIPGSGTIVYAGNPQSVTKSVTGSGAITGT